MAFHKSVIGFPVIIAVTAYMMAGETSGAFPPTLSDGLEQKIYNCNPAGR